MKSNRGGARPGSGPKPKISRDRIEKAAFWAEAMWNECGCDAIIKEILAQKGDSRDKTTIMARLLDYRFGRPVQPVTQDAGQATVVHLVHHVPRPER